MFVARIRVRSIKNRPLFEVTIPRAIADLLGLEHGEYVELRIRKVGVRR